jgi:hypothetical protein
VDRQPAEQRREFTGLAGFPMLDAATESDVEQAAGAGVSVERG